MERNSSVLPKFQTMSQSPNPNNQASLLILNQNRSNR